MVLIFSIKYDHTTNLVMHWLNHYKVKAVRVNGDDDVYKFDKITKDGIFLTNTISKTVINLLEFEACWWRRTGITQKTLNYFPPLDSPFFEDPIVKKIITRSPKYIKDESKALIDYIFYAIQKKCRVNLGSPVFNLNRLVVLDMAKEEGLNVPDYEIVNNGDQLSASRQTIGKSVTKSIDNGIYSDIEGHRYYTYTELIDKEFYPQHKQGIFFPSLISGLINKQIEIRSFYIDGTFFSMSIFSQNSKDTMVDFRKNGVNRTEPYKLPNHIESKLDNLFKALKLNCGSVDLILDKNDNYIFLEINPVGQFSMTSEPCNYNLEKIVAKYLIDGKRAN